jgi:hypothetical protein
MQEISNGRTLFVHAYDYQRKNHLLIGVHENIPADLTAAEIKKRFGLADRHTAYVKEPSGERIYVLRHPEWRGRK